MFDKKYFRFLILTVSALLLCFSLYLSASADSFTVPSGAVSLTGSGYTASDNFFDSELSVGGSVPSGYSLCGVLISPLRAGNGNTYVWYIYTTRENTFSTSLNNNGSVVVSCSGSFYSVANSVDSSGNNTYLTQSSGSVGTGNSSNWIFYSYIPIYNPSGELLTPPSYVDIDLNVLLSSHHMLFNTSCSSISSGSVDYYIFPSTLPLISYSSVVASGNTLSLSQDSNMQESLIDQGFSWFVNKVKSAYNPVADFYGLPPSDVTSSDSYSLNLSLSNGTQNFNPNSFNLPFSFLGSGSFDRTMYIDFKSISRTGVYSFDNLCLLAVYHGSEGYSYVRFDFNLALILSDNFVPPTHVQNTPAPSGSVSDLQDLADYLKDLADNNFENNTIDMNNFFGLLGSMPWANFVGTGFTNALPNLSFTLDSLFDSLFDKFTAPTQNQIDEMYADVQAERTELRAKLDFVDDVKTEYYFVISTITADNNSVPPDFEFSLPSIWSGGQTIRVKLISYEIATPEIMSNIKQVITVFLSLALLLHIWRTLPSTVGNMPRGDD